MGALSWRERLCAHTRLAAFSPWEGSWVGKVCQCTSLCLLGEHPRTWRGWGVCLCMNPLSCLHWWDWHMGNPANRAVGNWEPHTSCIEAERDGTAPTVTMFLWKETGYFFVTYLPRAFLLRW